MTQPARDLLTEDQERFISGWCGSIKRTAESVGVRAVTVRTSWMKKPAFRAAVLEHAKKMREEAIEAGLALMENSRLIAGAAEVQQWLTGILTGEETEQKLVTLRDADGNSYIEKVEVEADLAAKLKAADMLLKSHGAFVIKQEVTVEGGDKPIQVERIEIEDRLKIITGQEIDLGPDAPKVIDVTPVEEDWLE